MCTVCGCGEARVEGSASHGHGHGHGYGHGHDHGPGHVHDHRHDEFPERREDAAAGGTIDFGAALGGVHIAGLSQARTIEIERDILSKNDVYARANRVRLAKAGVLALNLLSSPGAGKTSLLVQMIGDLRGRRPIAVIEGDQQTSRDADRIRAAGAPAVQINTGKGCHLDAHMVGHALDALPLPPGGLLMIENVGNLVCPAAFDLGEARKVVVLSVTEGEDKPLKYPDMFAAADLLVINKVDLLPHLDFDMAACLAAARRVNPRADVLQVSSRTGQGLPALYAWIEAAALHASAASPTLAADVAAR
jgi:hydrogenase nickel incorporation protein HypB